jgi:NitT/TauT family transport system permease protein
MSLSLEKAGRRMAPPGEHKFRFRLGRIPRGLVTDLCLPIGFAAFVLLVWQVVTQAFHVPPYILPSPTQFLSVLVQRADVLTMMAKQTAEATLIGFALGVTIGLAIGGIMGSSRFLYDMIYPSLVGVHAVPSVALIPMFIVWVGIGPQIAVITGTIASFFPVTVIVASAIAASSPELDDVLRSLGARKIDVLLKVSIPQALPQFFGSIKLAISGAFIGTVVAEIVAGSVGIGHVMVIATNNMDGPLAYAGLTILAIMGIALYLTAVFVEKRLTGWAYRRG